MGSPVSHRKYQWAGLLAWTALNGWLSVRILGALDQPGAGWALCGGLVVSIFLADFFSGLVHWAFDRYGTVNMPVLGPGFIKPFRDHHTDPMGICGHNFVETNGNSCISCIPMLMLGIAIDPMQHLFLVTLIFGTAVGVFGTNQFHSWAHQPEVPWYARWLQRTRLVLGPVHHERHHSGDFDSYYCITNGWMNPFMERTGVFRRFEARFPPTVRAAETAATMTDHATQDSHGHTPHLPPESASRLQG
jgi:hypothetical protein